MALSENIKLLLGKVPLVYRLNSWNKTRILKSRLRELDTHYEALPMPAVWQGLSPHQLPDVFLRDIKNKLPRNLKTLFVGTMEAQDQSGTLQALERLSDQFTFFTKDDGTYGLRFPGHNKRTTAHENGERLWSIFEELSQSGRRPDLVIGQMQGLNMDPSVLQRIRDTGTVIINITMDDRLPHLWLAQKNADRRGAISLAPFVDLTLTTCANCVDWYRKEGQVARFTSLASDPSMAVPAARRDIGISFVGNKYGVRGEIVRTLTDAGFNVETFGRGWPNGPVPANRVAEINGRSQIILGIGTVAHTRDVYTMKLRDFDSLMSGACYITHRNRDLLRIFEEGTHLLCYENKQELIEVLTQAVKDPDRLKLIGSQGAQACLKDHTWDKHFSEVFELFGWSATQTRKPV